MSKRRTSILIRSSGTTLVYPVQGSEEFERHLRSCEQVKIIIEDEEAGTIEQIVMDVTNITITVGPKIDYELAEQETIPGAPVDLDPSDSDPGRRTH